MPTRTHKVGDKTWYDEVGEFDEERKDEEPGYSDYVPGCLGIAFKVSAVIAAVLCLCIVGG